MSLLPYKGKYKILPAIVFAGTSTDYPFVGWIGQGEPIYLFPDSILCSCPHVDLSKSEKNRRESNILTIGQRVQILVDGRDFMDDNIVKAFHYQLKEFNLASEYSDGLNYKITCVVSDELPPQCFIDELGITISLLSPVTPKPIPNVVYDAILYAKCELRSGGALEVDFRLTRIIGVKTYYTDELYVKMTQLLRQCPWNEKLLRILPRPAESDTELREFNLPPPQQVIKNDVLWFFEDNDTIVVSRNYPKTNISITVDPSKLKLESGQCFIGNLMYNEFLPNNGYLLVKYSLPPLHVQYPHALQMKKRAIVEWGLPLNEYFVHVFESCLFKGFYICNELAYNLIADPKLLLRNVFFENHREKGVPVWIRFEKGVDRLARFSIGCLCNNLKSDFSPMEKMMDYPNIHGIGILIDLNKGAVFSENHPQTTIRISVADKCRIPLGCHFYFNAAFFRKRKYYLVGNIQLIYHRTPVDTYRLGNLLLFKTRCRCYTIQTETMHLSEDFGPVLDSTGSVTKMARKMGMHEYPAEIEGYVHYNTDWICGRDSQLMLYSRNEMPFLHSMDSKPLEDLFQTNSEALYVTKMFAERPDDGEEWWRKRHIDEDDRCRCQELWYLLKNVMMNETRDLKEKSINKISELLDCHETIFR